MQRFFKHYIKFALIVFLSTYTIAIAQDNPETSGRSEVPADTIPELLKSITNYQWGDSRASMVRIEEELRSAANDPDLMNRIEERFITMLGSGASPAAKQFVCEKLSIYGSEKSVPALTTLLQSRETEEMALYALGRLPYKSVLVVLHKALKKAPEQSQLALIQTIGAKKYPESVDHLIPYAKSKNPEVAKAAIRSLGWIGGKKSEKYFEKRLSEKQDDLRSHVLFAYLDCGETYRQTGSKKDAHKVYTTILEKADNEQIQFAALRGMLILEPETASSRLVSLLKSGDRIQTRLAIRLINEIPEGQDIGEFISHREEFSPGLQIELITMLASRSEPPVSTMLIDAADGPDEQVRLAALRVMGNRSDPELLRVLAAKAAAGKGQEQKIARESLVSMQGRSVDDHLIKMLQEPDNAPIAEIIRALGDRFCEHAAPVLIPFMDDPNPDIRMAAIRALRNTGNSDELEPVLAELTDPESGKERDELKKTVNAILQKQDSYDLAPVLSYLEKAKTAEDRMAFYDILGASGYPAAVPQLHGSLKNDPPELRIAAIRAVNQWPDHTFMKDLWEIASSTKDEKTRVLALRGYVRTIPLDPQTSDTEKSALYEKAMKRAQTISDKQMILSGIAETPSIQAFRFVERYMGDKDLNQEAEAALMKMAEGLPVAHATAVLDVLQTVAEHTSNESLGERLKGIIERLDRFEGHITDWLAAGPYEQENVNLLDAVFPPEMKAETAVEWTRLQPNADPDQYWYLPLDVQFAGDNRVIYLKNRIWSNTGRDVQLEVGSDDGIKVWLNGELVHRMDAARGVTPGEDKIPVRLNEGWNDLLMKISNGGGQFGACARFRNRDGSRLSGLKVELPE